LGFTAGRLPDDPPVFGFAVGGREPEVLGRADGRLEEPPDGLGRTTGRLLDAPDLDPADGREVVGREVVGLEVVGRDVLGRGVVVRAPVLDLGWNVVRPELEPPVRAVGVRSPAVERIRSDGRLGGVPLRSVPEGSRRRGTASRAPDRPPLDVLRPVPDVVVRVGRASGRPSPWVEEPVTPVLTVGTPPGLAAPSPLVPEPAPAPAPDGRPVRPAGGFVGGR
jgi:hypothetical protein